MTAKAKKCLHGAATCQLLNLKATLGTSLVSCEPLRHKSTNPCSQLIQLLSWKSTNSGYSWFGIQKKWAGESHISQPILEKNMAGSNKLTTTAFADCWSVVKHVHVISCCCGGASLCFGKAQFSPQPPVLMDSKVPKCSGLLVLRIEN